MKCAQYSEAPYPGEHGNMRGCGAPTWSAWTTSQRGIISAIGARCGSVAPTAALAATQGGLVVFASGIGRACRLPLKKENGQMSFKLVVAGATGALGTAVVELAKQRGWHVTALGRSREKLAELGAHDTIVVSELDKNGRGRPELVERLQGHACVFSCLGASVHPNAGNSRTYTQVDTPCSRALIAAAKQAKVPKFVYVSLANAKPLLHLDYVKAHEEVVEMLKSSGLNHAVVRPTGFFSAF